MEVSGVLLAAPGAGRSHWLPRPGPGEELILLEEFQPSRHRHASAFPAKHTSCDCGFDGSAWGLRFSLDISARGTQLWRYTSTGVK